MWITPPPCGQSRDHNEKYFRKLRKYLPEGQGAGSIKTGYLGCSGGTSNDQLEGRFR
jgi:hypothetical protein